MTVTQERGKSTYRGKKKQKGDLPAKGNRNIRL